jgi:hypothetical protein
MAKQFPRAGETEAPGTKMISAWLIPHEASRPHRGLLKSPLERGEKEPREFYNGILRGFCATHLPGPVYWAERIFLYGRDSIGPQPRRNRCENRGAVTTRHLLWPNEQRKPDFLLPIWLPNSIFRAANHGRPGPEGGGGGLQHAGAKSAVSDRLAQKFRPKGTPPPSWLLKKNPRTRARILTRLGSPLSHELAFNYR